LFHRVTVTEVRVVLTAANRANSQPITSHYLKKLS